MNVNIKEIGKILATGFIAFLVSVALVALIAGIIHNWLDKQDDTSSPVEEMRIDSLKNENTKLKEEVKLLEEIRDERIEEVKVLDNDSTVMLFYELIRK